MLNPTKAAAMYDEYKAFVSKRDTLLSGSAQEITELVRDHLPNSFIARLAGAPMRPLDVIVEGADADPDYCARLIEAALKGGAKALIYAVFDHRSKPDPDMGRHLGEYLPRVWDWYGEKYPDMRVEIIMPLLVYSGCAQKDVPKFARGPTSIAGLGAGKPDIATH